MVDRQHHNRTSGAGGPGVTRESRNDPNVWSGSTSTSRKSDTGSILIVPWLGLVGRAEAVQIRTSAPATAKRREVERTGLRTGGDAKAWLGERGLSPSRPDLLGQSNSKNTPHLSRLHPHSHSHAHRLLGHHHTTRTTFSSVTLSSSFSSSVSSTSCIEFSV